MQKAAPTRIQKKNRAAILEAALDVFSTHGFRGATVDQIATAAGLSKPNLLYYFPSKEAMHTALLHRWFAFVVTALIIASTVPMIRAAKRQGRASVRTFALIAHALVVLQVVLGFAALLYYVPVSLATIHQGVGALLLIDLVALYVTAGPWGARLSQSRESTAPATGAFEGLLSASR